MLRIEKRIGGSVLAAAVCFAFFILQGLFIEDAHSQNSSVGSSSGAGDARALEFEKTLKLLRSEDAMERHQAVVSLGKTANPAAVEPLIHALKDSDYFVRSFAAIALGNLKDPRALEPLIGALTDEHQRVRRSAAEALGSMKDSHAVDALIKAMSDENVIVQRSAAQALGTIGDPRAVSPLIKALGSSDSYISTGASTALTAMGPAAIPELVGALGGWILGPRIAEVLKSLNWVPAADEETVRFYVASRNREALLQNWEKSRKVLLADMNSGDAGRSENAVYALIGIGKEEVLDPLASILRSKGSLAIAQAFLDCGHVRLSEIARSWAKENGKEVRAANETAVVKWGILKS